MKILYAIQGTGNGHLSRALEILPVLRKRGEVDILISGSQVDLKVPYPVKYSFRGFGYIFGKSDGVDILSTYFKMKTRTLAKEIKSLPIEKYDFVINDFEPVSAWAAFFKNKPCIGLSNQNAILSVNSPKPKHRDLLGELVLKYYAPATAKYGFHFARFDESMFTPVIRKEIREAEISNQGHYTVYLPAYDEQRIIRNLSAFPDIKWEVFSKHSKSPFRHRNVHIKPVINEDFIKSLASSEGLISAAGFGATSEAIFLNKKLLVIPMKHQYEQHCNAAALKVLGVPAIKSLKEKHLPRIEDWLENGKICSMNYPNNTEEIIDHILSQNSLSNIKRIASFTLNSLNL